MTKQTDSIASYPLGPALDFLQRLWQLNHTLEKVSCRMEKRLGVTAQQRLILRCVGRYPSMTAGQLAHLLHVNPGTVSASLARLETKGLLDRRRDPRDRRRASLGLTSKGRTLDRPTEGTVESAVEQLLALARAEDLAAMVAIVEQLTGLLVEELQAIVPPCRAGRFAIRSAVGV